MWTVDRATGSLRREPEPRRASRARIPTGLPTTSRSCSRPATATRPGGASLAVIPLARTAVGRAHEDRRPAPERHEQADADQPVPDALPGRQVDRLLARQGRPRRPDLRSCGRWPPPAATPVELVNANRVVSNQMTRRPAREQPSRPGRRRATTTGSRSTRCAPYGVVLPKGHAADLGRGGRSRQARAGRRRPELPGLPAAVPGAERGQPPRLLDARRSLPRHAPAASPHPTAACAWPTGAPCDPVVDRCCDSDERCDTMDDGKTYTCRLF